MKRERKLEGERSEKDRVRERREGYYWYHDKYKSRRWIITGASTVIRRWRGVRECPPRSDLFTSSSSSSSFKIEWCICCQKVSFCQQPLATLHVIVDLISNNMPYWYWTWKPGATWRAFISSRCQVRKMNNQSITCTCLATIKYLPKTCSLYIYFQCIKIIFCSPGMSCSWYEIVSICKN